MYGHVIRFGKLFSKEDVMQILNAAAVDLFSKSAMNCELYSDDWVDCPGEESCSAEDIIRVVSGMVRHHMETEQARIFDDM